MAETPLIEVSDVCVHFPILSGLLRRRSGSVKAVDGVSFAIPRGITMGLVGESGSGKTTLGRAILNLVTVTSGKILLDGRDITNLRSSDARPLRRRMQVIFQDPFNSLNPRLTIAQIVGEAFEIHFPEMRARQRRQEVAKLLETVGLDRTHIDRYPHEFSGGQRQRIGIARALAVKPDFIVCDEPVSALDVSVQAQIINLLRDLQDQFGLTYLFIAHDLAVVEYISDHVLVMYQGKIVESAPADTLYKDPAHEYTRRLLEAVPAITPTGGGDPTQPTGDGSDPP